MCGVLKFRRLVVFFQYGHHSQWRAARTRFYTIADFDAKKRETLENRTLAVLPLRPKVVADAEKLR